MLLLPLSHPHPPKLHFGAGLRRDVEPGTRQFARAVDAIAAWHKKKIQCPCRFTTESSLYKGLLRIETDAQAHFFFSSAGLSLSRFICPSREPRGSYSLERKGLDLPVICVEDCLCLVLEAVAIP